MKTKRLLLLVAASGLLLGPRQLLAEDPPPPPPPVDGINPKIEGEHGRRRLPEHRGPEMKATPFIGVMTHSLSPEVRAQTGLQEGFGLLVEEVLPESPAKTAGMLQHDVLVLLGDQRLVNTEQLSALVRSSAKGSELVFTLKRAGAEQKVTVKVGEKMMPAMQFDGPSRWPGGRSWGGGFDGERFGQELGKGIDRFQQGMREFQERMQEWSKGPRDRPAPQPPQFDRGRGAPGEGERRGPPPNAERQKDEAARSSSSTSSSSSFERNVTRKDKTGEYGLRQEGDQKIFTVKPTDGAEQSFPVTTEEQRKAVPEPFLDKLHELDEVSRRVKGKQAEEGEAPPPPPGPGGRGASI